MLMSNESNISSTPPKAGIALLESLASASLFITDSIKSPHIPETPINNPKGIIK